VRRRRSLKFLYNLDCIAGARKHLKDESMDLLICDPPFGLGESKFGAMYNRDPRNVIGGYDEAPPDYGPWTREWMGEAMRVMKPEGSMYVVSGHTNRYWIETAARDLGLGLVNEIIWKYNFGVYTKRKFVTSHYTILYLAKSRKARLTFNRECRFTDDERTPDDRSAQYRDREDVWYIPREPQRGGKKNANKLPDALVWKMIEYSSNAGDKVCDLFLGNFTTARVALSLGRIPIGFELNREAFQYHLPRLRRLVCDSPVKK
jgi:site-specific DNA-methyltransferase (adenine-specific)